MKTQVLANFLQLPFPACPVFGLAHQSSIRKPLLSIKLQKWVVGCL